MKKFLYVILFLFFTYPFLKCYSKTINVPAEYNSIQSALNAAQINDTVLVQPGVYYESIIWPNTNSIKLISAGDTTNTFIDGENSLRNINLIHNSIDTSTYISGFCFINGNSNLEGGGAIQIINAGITLENISVKNCQALELYGGAIYASNSHIIIKNSQFYKNRAKVCGAIYAEDNSLLSILGSQIYNNEDFSDYTKIGAGGISINESTFRIDSCEVIGNHNNYLAGGLSLIDSDGKISNTEISYNSAYANSACYIIEGIDTLDNVIISNNYAQSQNIMGSIWCQSSLTVIDNCTIVDNLDNGILTRGLLELNESKLINNFSGLQVGDLASGRTGSAKITSCIFANNKFGLDAQYFSDTLTVNHSSFILNVRGVSGEQNTGTRIIIRNSNFQDNKYGYWSSQNNFSINNSNFYENEVFGIFSQATTSFGDAKNNWWGDKSGPNQYPYSDDALGDKISQYINVTPYSESVIKTTQLLSVSNLQVDDKSANSLSLSWSKSVNDSVKGYYVYYDIDSSNYNYRNKIDVGNVLSYNLIGLSPSTTYYLKVTCYNYSGNESWFSDKLVMSTKLSTPVLIAPENNSTDITISPVLEWSPVTNSDTYRIEVNTKSDFTGNIIYDLDTLSTNSVNLTFSSTTKYYWRVTALNSFGNISDPSSIYNFTTTNINSLEGEEKIVKRFALYQNFPNPFNPTTQIKYQLPKYVYVTIKLYDILGREISVLLDKEQKAGYYEISFDGSQLSSGTYIYQIIAGDFTDSKKLLLMK